MANPQDFKELPLGSNSKIGMLIPETLMGEPLNHVTPLQDQEVKFSRDAFISLRDKVSKIQLSKTLACIMDYLLEYDKPKVRPIIAQMEVTPDSERLLICSSPEAPHFFNYVLCAEFELAMALKAMATDYHFTDAEVDCLAYQLAKKCPESPRLVVPCSINAKHPLES